MRQEDGGTDGQIDRQKQRQTDRQTFTMKLIVAFCRFAKATKN